MEDIKETKKCGERGFGGEGYHWRPLCYEHMLYPFTQTWVRGASVGSLGSLRWMFLQLEMLWSKIWLPPWESGGMRECMTDCFSGGVRRLLQAGISLQPTLLRQEIWCFLGGSAHQGSSGVPMKWPLKVLHKRKTQLSTEQEMSSGRHHRVSPFLLCVVPWGLGRADCFHSSSAGAWQFKFELWLSIIEGGYSSFSLEAIFASYCDHGTVYMNEQNGHGLWEPSSRDRKKNSWALSTIHTLHVPSMPVTWAGQSPLGNL